MDIVDGTLVRETGGALSERLWWYHGELRLGILDIYIKVRDEQGVRSKDTLRDGLFSDSCEPERVVVKDLLQSLMEIPRIR